MDLHGLLKTHFGYDAFRPGQEQVINALIESRCALAVFPTGGGKSLCYQLPALAFEGVTLVVSPLIALMKDQIDFLTRRGIAAARLDSSLGADDARQVIARARAGELKLLYVAPERFNNERFLDTMKRLRIGLFAVDEAHCISEWGHNFRPDYLKIAQIARDVGAERVLALTATATPSVVADICAAFAIPPTAAVVTGFYRPNLKLATTPVGSAQRDSLLLKRLKSRKPGPTIVYVTLQKSSERVAAMLCEAGFEADAYHAGMETEQRTAVQERWMASDAGIVVATIAFGMGIDKSDVRYIYHYNLPKSLESYSQEIGRAGRDGLSSTVEMFATPDDLPMLANFTYGDTPTLGSLRGLLNEILALGAEFSLNLVELSNRYDIRPLVMRTTVTYLEIDGILRQGTPYYAGYQIRPLIPVADIVAQYTGEPSLFLQGIFEHAKHARSWISLSPDEAAEALGQSRSRIVRALDVLAGNGWVELRAADLRNRYVRLQEAVDADAVAADLHRRFLNREQQEQQRLDEVLDLITADRCQTGALAAHFGEVRPKPCGHCTHCITGRAQALPAPAPLPPLPGPLSLADWVALREAHPAVLGEARQGARFLCGLSSPASARARLSRHSLFGSLDAYPFMDVVRWLSSEQ